MKLLGQEVMSPELSNLLTEKLLSSIMDKPQIEDLEDERYIHVNTRSQSRFAVPVNPNEVMSIEFHPSGKFLAYGRIDGSLTIWILDSSSYAKARKIYLADAIDIDKMVYSLSWNANETSQFATVANTSEIFIWGIDEGKRSLTKLRTLTVGSKVKLFKCFYDPMGNWLLAVTKSEELYLFNVRSDHEMHSTFDVKAIVPDDSIYCVSWNNSGSHIFLGLKSGKLVVLELDETEGISVKSILSSHRASLNCVKMDPWGRYVVTGSTDGTCCIWDLKTLCCELCIDEFDCSVSQVDIDALGKILAICTTDGVVRFYDINSGHLFLQQKIKNSNSDVILLFKPDSTDLIISGKQDILQSHFTPNHYHDVLSLWKTVHEKSRSTSRNKNNISSTINNPDNTRRPNKRVRDHDRITNNSKRERVSQRTSRFTDKRQ